MSLHTYREDGDGLPLVLLHGFPLDHRMWDDVAAPAPAPAARCTPWTCPGRPGTRPTCRSPRWRRRRTWSRRRCAAPGSSARVVAGLSMGGYVALALVERHPDLVAGLALVDTKSTADAPEARANRLRIADEAEATGSVDPVRPMAASLLGETTRAARPEVADEVAAWIDQQEPAGHRLVAAGDGRTAGPLGRAPRRSAGPSSSSSATRTPSPRSRPPSTWSRRAAGARLVVVPHAGHLSAVEQPAAVAAALADLAAATDPA